MNGAFVRQHGLLHRKLMELYEVLAFSFDQMLNEIFEAFSD